MTKSRLASSVGDELAAVIYKIMLEHIVQVVCTGRNERALYCYPDIQHAFFEYCCSRYNIPLHNQEGCNLGTRMFNSITAHLNDTRHVALVGSDCPELEPAYIDKAFNLLEAGNDIVLGPTHDGGYALIGAKKIDRTVFDNISWGTGKVLQQTQENIQNLCWKSACLPSLRDVDTFSDYCYFLEHKRYKHLFSSINNCSASARQQQPAMQPQPRTYREGKEPHDWGKN